MTVSARTIRIEENGWIFERGNDAQVFTEVDKLLDAITQQLDDNAPYQMNRKKRKRKS